MRVCVFFFCFFLPPPSCGKHLQQVNTRDSHQFPGKYIHITISCLGIYIPRRVYSMAAFRIKPLHSSIFHWCALGVKAMWWASPPDSHTLDFFLLAQQLRLHVGVLHLNQSGCVKLGRPSARRLPNGGRGRKAQVARLGGQRGLDAARRGLRGGRCVFNTEVFHQLSHAATPGTGWRRAPQWPGLRWSGLTGRFWRAGI